MAKPIHDVAASIHPGKTKRARIEGFVSFYSCSFRLRMGFDQPICIRLIRCDARAALKRNARLLRVGADRLNVFTAVTAAEIVSDRRISGVASVGTAL